MTATISRRVAGRVVYLRVTSAIHHSVPTYQAPTMRAIPHTKAATFTAGPSELSHRISSQIDRRSPIVQRFTNDANLSILTSSDSPGVLVIEPDRKRFLQFRLYIRDGEREVEFGFRRPNRKSLWYSALTPSAKETGRLVTPSQSQPLNLNLH